MSRKVLLCGSLLALVVALACAQPPAPEAGEEPEEPGKRAFSAKLDDPAAAPITLCQQGSEGCAPCQGAKLGLTVNGGQPVEASCWVRSADGRGCRNGSSTVVWTLEPFDAWGELGPLRLEVEAKGRGGSPEAYGAAGHPTSAVLTATHNRMQSRFPESIDLAEGPGNQTDWYYDVRLFRVTTGEIYACSDPIVIIKDP